MTSPDSRSAPGGRADIAIRAAKLLAHEHARGALATDDYDALYAWCVTPEIDAVAAGSRQ